LIRMDGDDLPRTVNWLCKEILCIEILSLFSLHLVYFANDLKRFNKKTFFKNHFLLNKGFQDLTLANNFKKKLNDLSNATIHLTTPYEMNKYLEAQIDDSTIKVYYASSAWNKDNEVSKGYVLIKQFHANSYINEVKMYQSWPTLLEMRKGYFLYHLEINMSLIVLI